MASSAEPEPCAFCPFPHSTRAGYPCNGCAAGRSTVCADCGAPTTNTNPTTCTRCRRAATIAARVDRSRLRAEDEDLGLVTVNYD